MSGRQFFPATCLLLISATTSLAAQATDPPTRVGRVSEMAGNVSLRPVGSKDWTPASINYPLTTGDAVWAAEGSRGEVHVGASALQLAPATSVTFDSLTDRTTRLTIERGSTVIRVRTLAADESFEIRTAGGRVVLHGDGSYRVDVTPDGKRGTVTVRSGQAELIAGYEAYPVLPGSAKTFTGVAKSPIATGTAILLDTWEAWADSLNRDEDSSEAAQYLSRDVVGYEELDNYGDWNTTSEYGPVWQPRAVSVGWSPYRYGRWESVAPWGWTWLPEEPWGFATSHYGRWAELGGRWSWLPGSSLARQVYAPAVVAFLNNGTAIVTNQSGIGSVGWLPLGPGDPYYPGYPVSARYMGAINSNYLPPSGWSFAAWNPLQNAINNQYQYYNLNRSNSIIYVSTTVFVSGYRVGSSATPFDSRKTQRPSAVPTTYGTPIRPVTTTRPRVIAEGPSPYFPTTTVGTAPGRPVVPGGPPASSNRQAAPVANSLANPAYATGRRVAPTVANNSVQSYSPQPNSSPFGNQGQSSQRRAPMANTAQQQVGQQQMAQYPAPVTRQRTVTVQSSSPRSAPQPMSTRSAPQQAPGNAGGRTVQPVTTMPGTPPRQARAQPPGGGGN